MGMIAFHFSAVFILKYTEQVALCVSESGTTTPDLNRVSVSHRTFIRCRMTRFRCRNEESELWFSQKMDGPLYKQ